MADTILQTYLNDQHIKVADDKSVESLNKAVADIKKQLAKKKAEIIPFTLVALDPKVRDTDPVVQQVEAIIIKKWAAFKNSVTATHDKSTTYVRAVVLEALSQLAKDDAVNTALVWLTARDAIGHYQLGPEETVIRALLQQLADQTEENGQAVWGISRKLFVKDFQGAQIAPSGSKAARIDEETLKGHLLNAMVHRGWSSSAGGGQNPHYEGQHSWQWSKYAAEHSANGIAEVVNSALSQQAQSLSSFSASVRQGLDAYFAQLKPFIEDLNASFAKSITSSNKRSELLWWKQSLYSSSLRSSYRSLGGLNVAVCAAIDLAEQVEGIYPESVDYLLRETLKDVLGEHATEERPLTDWLTDSGSLHKDLRLLLEKYAQNGDERKHLLNAWANVAQSGNATGFSAETGIGDQSKLTVSDLAVWMFHGLQAQKLATAK